MAGNDDIDDPLGGHPSRELVVRWGGHLAHDRRRSPHTVRAYQATAHRFIDFLGRHRGEKIGRFSLLTLQASDLRAFLAERRTEGLGASSAAREMSAVRAFLTFAAEDAGEVPQVPYTRAPKRPRTLPRAVAPDDATALAEDARDGAASDWIGKRDLAILLLLYGSGLRISEAMGLTAGILPLGSSVRVIGKGNKGRVVPILPAVGEAISAYVDAAPWPMGTSDPLFRGARGGALSADMVRRAVRAARQRLGLPDSLTPHALRHSFATHLLAGGADLRSLQELLGHASLSSTQVYTNVDAAHLLDVYRNAHPRAK
ncbi:tyrosine recombinase XerC [Sphingomicrobium flavum]|uniref:tyrosine recombinase XerC n=1 Tax=Sphingomicrobium flavum TaxID=1229164 RepID=UPI0021AE0AF2|nr:tyrosine recombinase XerC [Sphingomicrobium flavum]